MNQYDHLKNKLHHYKVEIDKEKLWKNTSHAIPKRKKRLAAPLMLFAGLIMSALIMYSSSADFRDSLSAEMYLKDDQDHSNARSNPRSINNSGELIQFNTGEVDVLPSNFSAIDSKPISQNNQTASVQFSTPVTGNVNGLSNSPKNKSNIDKTNASVSENKDHFSISKTINLQDEYLATVIDQNASSKPKPAAGEWDAFNPLKENEFQSIGVRPFSHVSFLNNEISPIPIQTMAVASTGSHNPTITAQKKPFLQSFQIVQGVGFLNMKIHSLTPEADVVVAQLQQKMRPLELLTTSATASLSLPGNFTIEPGFQLSRLTTALDQKWETSDRIQQEGIASIIIDEQGNPQSITGNINATQTTHYHAKRFTEHTHFDMVLAIHKVLWRKQRTSINTFLKGAYNLSYHAKGTILNGNEQLISFTNDDNPYKINSPFKFSGGIELSYMISSHWQLTTSMTFDRAIYSLSEENKSIRFTHTGFSPGLGIGYIF